MDNLSSYSSYIGVMLRNSYSGTVKKSVNPSIYRFTP